MIEIHISKKLSLLVNQKYDSNIKLGSVNKTNCFFGLLECYYSVL